MKKIKHLTAIGFWVILSLTLLYFGINYLKGLAIFDQESSYYARFNNVTGVTIATPVLINGYKVGTVQGLEFDIENQATTLVKMNIQKDLKITSGTQAMIRTSIFGGAEINLILGKTQTALGKDEYISVVDAEMDPMTVLSQSILPQIVNMLPKIDASLTAINKITNSPEFSKIVTETHSTIANANKTMLEAKKLISQINQSTPTLLASAQATAKRINNFSKQLDSIELDKLIANLGDTSEELKNLLQKMNNPNSSFGQLLNDKKLYNEVNTLLSDIDALVKDIKENPKKYVKLSLF